MIADPLLEGGEAFGLDAAGAYVAELLGVHERAFFEDLEVLGYGGEGDVEGGGEGGDGEGSVAEPVQLSSGYFSIFWVYGSAARERSSIVLLLAAFPGQVLRSGQGRGWCGRLSS